jgi:hypothetical protein
VSLSAAIDAALARLAAASLEAQRGELPAPLRAYDARWLTIELDRWVRTPAKVAAATQHGRLHLAVHWDQCFAVRAFPRASFDSLARVLAYYRATAGDPALADLGGDAWARLFPRGRPLAASLDAQRALWERLAAEHPVAEVDGGLYVDFGALLRGTACHWSGHWTFDGVVLDRYAGDRIDFAHYAGRVFHADGAHERFDRFRRELEAAGVTRETTWSLLTPSGERTWKVAAVLAMDGNADVVLLEGAEEWAEVTAMGS